MRLIQQRGELAEHGTGLGHLSDLDAILDEGDRALLEDQQPSCRPAGSEHGLAGLVGCERKGACLAWKTVGFGMSGMAVQAFIDHLQVNIVASGASLIIAALH